MSESIFQANKCPLTGYEKPKLKVVEMGISKDFGKKGYQWYYPFNEELLLIAEYDLYHDKEFWERNKSSIFYLVENEIWPIGKMVDKPLLQALISSSGIPRSPFEKMEEILSYISINQNHFGEWFSFDSKDYDFLVRRIGVFNADELEGIIKESSNHGLLEIKANHSSGMVVILSLKGWQLADERNQAKESNSVFIAMSFDPGTIQIYNDWIEPAIKESGFEPYIVFNQHPESDVTINDAILAGIK